MNIKEDPSISQLSKLALEAASGGVNLIQLRTKTAPSRFIYDLVLQIKETLSAFNCQILVNDRADIALAADLDGVHLPATGLPPDQVKKLLGSEKIIGYSAHTLEEAEWAKNQGCDFITYSPIFETSSKPNLTPLGIQKLTQVCRQIKMPIFALGGIKLDNVRSVINAGAFGIAVVSAIAEASDPESAASYLLNEIVKAGLGDN